MTESPAKKIYRVTPPKAIKNWKKRVSGRLFFSADREGWFY
jgi:hypothetical protein